MEAEAGGKRMSLWKRWRAGGAGLARDRVSESAARPPEDRVDGIRAQLESRGVSSRVSGPVAARLERQLEIDPAQQDRALGAPGDSTQWLLDGVAEALQGLEANVSTVLPGGSGLSSEPDLRELERLMGAFAGELAKLEEVLDVLNAHVERMRAAQSEPGSFH